jgi:hypothetical protein
MKGLVIEKYRNDILGREIRYKIQLVGKQEKISVVLPKSISEFEVGNTVEIELKKVGGSEKSNES